MRLATAFRINEVKGDNPNYDILVVSGLSENGVLCTNIIAPKGEFYPGKMIIYFDKRAKFASMIFDDYLRKHFDARAIIVSENTIGGIEGLAQGIAMDVGFFTDSVSPLQFGHECVFDGIPEWCDEEDVFVKATGKRVDNGDDITEILHVEQNEVKFPIKEGSGDREELLKAIREARDHLTYGDRTAAKMVLDGALKRFDGGPADA